MHTVKELSPPLRLTIMVANRTLFLRGSSACSRIETEDTDAGVRIAHYNPESVSNISISQMFRRDFLKRNAIVRASPASGSISIQNTFYRQTHTERIDAATSGDTERLHNVISSPDFWRSVSTNAVFEARRLTQVQLQRPVPC